MVNEYVFRWLTMVKLGFIVEGATEKIIIESELFSSWLNENGCELVPPVIDANGGGNLLPQNISPMISQLNAANAGHIIVLTDLEHEENVQAVKDRITSISDNLIFVAVKAIEAWFLADTEAIKNWLEVEDYYEVTPENTPALPWERLKEVAAERDKRGPGNKVGFAKKMVNKCGFNVANAATHENSDSAKLFLTGLRSITP